MSIDTTRLYTRLEAAAYLGIAPSTLERQLRLGKAEYGCEERRGRWRLFTFAAIQAYAERQRTCQEKRDAAKATPDGKKQCRVCLHVKPLCEFYANALYSGGVGRDCRACSRKASAEYARRKPETGRAYRAATRSGRRAAKRKHYRAHTAQEIAERNAFKQEERAIEDGKNSPSPLVKQCGFFVALASNGTVRAARVGVPLDRGEKQIAHFEYSTLLNRWVVNLPTVLDASLSRRARNLVKRHGGYVQEGAMA